MTPMDELIAQAELGEEARRFMESDLGKCVLGMAEQHTQAALEALGNADPHDTTTIVKLQNEAKYARGFAEYLTELLTEGENAISVFKQQEAT